MAELKASPRNKYVGKAADVLRSIRDIGDEVQIPVLGGLGSLFLGKSPEEINEWSYGNAPMQRTPLGDRLPKMKRGRGTQVADTAFAAMDLPALRALTAAAGRPLARALEDSPLTRAAEFVGEQRTPVSAVVKPKGGNWLSGSVEDALRGLKQPGAMGARDAEELAAMVRMPINEARAYWASEPLKPINQWIEGPLTKYVKTRMASPDDEVRKLAEEGVLHFEPPVNPVSNAAHMRVAAGYPAKGEAKTHLGGNWENLADEAVRVRPASYYQQGVSEVDPWLLKALPESNVYDLESRGLMSGDLGFPHLIDELSNALNPTSGLPRHLQLTPEAMKQLSMEKAVRRVADINAWRAAQKAEANRKLAEQASIVREYAENNPKGLRWVELKAGDAEPNADVADDVFGPANADARHQALADQLKYEGDTMGHCVGGYCDDVLSGRARIFSLRDAKGEPHVTVEVEPPMFSRASRWGDLPQEEKTAMLWNLGSPGDKALLEKYGDDMQVYFRPDNTVRIMPPAELLDPETIAKSLNPRVRQIKGKQNRAPNEEYLPFVQDFVRNSPLGGQWSEVGDLGNTGLTRRSALDSAELRKAAPNQEWFTEPEIDALYDDVRKGIAEGKFASGGAVSSLPAEPASGYNSWQSLFGEA